LNTKSLQDLGGSMQADLTRRRFSVQLNWTEYFQGSWQARSTTSFDENEDVVVPNEFSTTDVFVHATYEMQGAERVAVKINLRFPGKVISYQTALANPVGATEFLETGSVVQPALGVGPFNWSDEGIAETWAAFTEE